MQISIRRRYSWAVLPAREEAQIQRAPDRSASNFFRWDHARRQEAACLPRNLGRQLGLYVRSPVDIKLHPIDAIEFACEDEDLDAIKQKLGLVETWRRDSMYLGFRDHTAYRQFEFRVGDHFETMFVPNGGSTLEWRLGFDLDAPEATGVLSCPLEDQSAFSMMYGYLPPSSLRRMNAGPGFSIAIDVHRPVAIKRGDLLGRLIPLPTSAFKFDYDFTE
ncbi:MAG: hypothetical protein AAFW88_11345 [Pseudomonadota bacterium]